MNHHILKPKRLLCLSLIVGFLFINLTVHAQLSGIYTIDGDKPMSQTNFTSFASAINALNTEGIDAAVTFNVASGFYYEQLYIDRVQGASETNTITFQSATGQNEDVVLVYPAVLDEDPHVVRFQNEAAFFAFRNMRFINSSEHYDLVFHFNNTHDVTLEGNKIESINTSNDSNNGFLTSALIGCTQNKNITISNNHLTNAKFGIRTTLYNNSNFLISGNTMESFEDYAISIYGSHTIENNEIKNSQNGTYSEGNITIKGNYIHGINRYGINCTSGLIINNVIDDPISEHGVCVFSSHMKSDMTIMQNTMISTGLYGRVLFLEYRSRGKLKIQNNNFYYGGTYYSLMSFDGRVYSDYNNLFVESECGKIYEGYRFSKTASRLKEWQALGNGLHSKQIDPNFFDGVVHAANNFLQFGDDLRSTVPTDREGNPHSATPYVGASTYIPHPNALSGTLTIPGNYSTVEAAITDLAAKGIKSSVTVNIAAGTYPGIKIPFIPGVTDNRTVTFTGPEATTDQVIFDGADEPALTFHKSASHIVFENTKLISTGVVVYYHDNILDVTLENNTIQSETTQNSLVHIDQYNSKDIFINNNIFDGGKNSIINTRRYCHSSHIGNREAINRNITITGNTFNNFNTTGIVLNDLEKFTIVNNMFSSNTNKFSTGINISNSSGEGKISGNTLQKIEKIGITISNTKGNAENPIAISNNRIFVSNKVSIDAPAKGMTLIQSSYINVYNNVIRVVENFVGGAHGVSFQSVSNTNTHHNSIWVHSYRDNAAVIAYNKKEVGKPYGEFNDFFNNIFSQTGTGDGYVYDIQEPESMGHLNNNVLHHTGTHLGFWKENWETINDWRFFTAEDVKSKVLDPEFVSNTNLRATNDAISGVAKDLTTIIPSDIDGKLRKPSPTAGAYENGDPGTPPVEDPIVLINEVDADSQGTDTLEFVELYDGGVGNTPLDGYVLVFYNGSNNKSYSSYDLDGYATDASGYFVIGSESVANVSYTFANNKLQNGADAVALYKTEEVFANGSVITTDNLIDAVVYDTNDADDAELLVLLNSGEPQINEGEKGNKDFHSIQRFPNGSGGLRNTNNYTQAIPTPGTANTDTVTVDDNKVGIIAAGFSIYPNPITSSVNINLPPATKNAKVMLFDLNGRLLVERNIDHGTSIIDMSHLTSGLYIIHLIDDNHSEVMKLKKL
ncbi:T9SS type A sorting domain-containing protein [Aquimarina megaterium]|uniref:T9SS type A sorting domain-containing protein n=1 Tax=Aquimarina megaterium TaxID=1443666 RepID=UPI0009457465|nr:T9SS type A sorting domain-containing protein [Aquimarina megaterium]